MNKKYMLWAYGRYELDGVEAYFEGSYDQNELIKKIESSKYECFEVCNIETMKFVDLDYSVIIDHPYEGRFREGLTIEEEKAEQIRYLKSWLEAENTRKIDPRMNSTDEQYEYLNSRFRAVSDDELNVIAAIGKSMSDSFELKNPLESFGSETSEQLKFKDMQQFENYANEIYGQLSDGKNREQRRKEAKQQRRKKRRG